MRSECELLEIHISFMLNLQVLRSFLKCKTWGLCLVSRLCLHFFHPPHPPTVWCAGISSQS